MESISSLHLSANLIAQIFHSSIKALATFVGEGVNSTGLGE